MSEVGNGIDTPRHEQYDVFISYRRSTGLDVARSVAYWFSLKGFKCFLDQTELLTGQFNEQIYSAIENTKYFVLLMTQDALDRCVNDKDWVRQEIEFAVKKLGKDCIIPITPLPSPPPVPQTLPQTMAFLKTCEVSVIDRMKNFDSTLRSVLEHRMPVLFDDFERRKQLSDNETQLLRTIRWYKYNDGTIDDGEMKKIHDAAREYQINEIRLRALIDLIEEEFAQERDVAIRRLIESCMADDGKIDSEERKTIDKKAEELQIPEARLTKILTEIEGLKKFNSKTDEARRYICNLEQANKRLQQAADKAQRDICDLEQANKNLKQANKRLQEAKDLLEGENTRLAEQVDESKIALKKKYRVFRILLSCVVSLLVILVGVCVWNWTEGANISNEQMHVRIVSETTRISAEAQRKIDSADKARTAAEKRASVSSLAREQAEKETKEIKAQLEAAKKTAEDSDSARQDAETRLAQAQAALETERTERAKNKEIIEGRRKELLNTLAEEQKARKNTEVLSAEKAAELERAAKKVQALESEKAKLMEELETVRRQKQIDALRDI